jgi:hypothetical protein
MDESELQYVLPLFPSEMREKVAPEYPPETLRQHVTSLQKHVEMEGHCEKFPSDSRYKVLSLFYYLHVDTFYNICDDRQLKLVNTHVNCSA